MKKFWVCISLLIIIGIVPFCVTKAQTVLQGYAMKVPENFFGIWRVTSKIIETDAPAKFKNSGVDLWNIFEANGVIKLSNPFSGAQAQISIDDAKADKIIFTKTGDYGNKILTDRVEIYINQDQFTGIDYIELQTKSDIDKNVIKTETATYKIKGERIAGQEIKGE